MRRVAPDVLARARAVRLVILDVDGVLTDGRIIYGTGGMELKAFDVRDGHGVKMFHRAGLRTAILTGRTSEVVARRAEELGIADVVQNAKDKLAAYRELLARHALADAQVACVGDDVTDLPLFARAGLAVAVPGAAPEARAAAHYVTRRAGGRGAVREVLDLILKAQGLWAEALARYGV
ncbi:MAG TPA: HAD-IIIA family hydrolase [Candidatus Sulfotelmatobacter sp.]|nr:HAD-IIIA family hydrolase [Candidatus Sulfotelmatobacter sp.]